jgi:hypothetical protein
MPKVLHMTLDFPSPSAPTSVLPSPPNPNNPSNAAILPPYAGFPASANNGGVQLTVLAAISAGILPAQVQVASYTPPGAAAISFTGYLNPTLNSLMQSGLIPSNALVSQLAFASSANYGGN